MLTRSPRLSSRQPIEAAARPLPKLDTTPPVTKTYFADMNATSFCFFGIGRTWWAHISMAENWGVVGGFWEWVGAGLRCCRGWAAMTSKIEVVKTDITTLAVDAIVNAAN